MRKTLLLIVTLAMAVLFVSAAGALRAQTPGVALTGTVTSAEEGAMEGVLVSAKLSGSNITTTVVSDAQGHYSFPAAKLGPGAYALSIRAAGYDLDGSNAITLSAANDSGPPPEENVRPRRAAQQRRLAQQHARNAGRETPAYRLHGLSYDLPDRYDALYRQSVDADHSSLRADMHRARSR